MIVRSGSQILSKAAAAAAIILTCISANAQDVTSTPELGESAQSSTPAPELTPTTAPDTQVTPTIAIESLTPTPVAGDNVPLTEIDEEEGITVELEDFERQAPRPVSNIQYIDIETPANIETVRQFDKESKGKYSATKAKLKACRELPIDTVWQHFSPFFTYRWSREFVSFAALFMAIWERESRFYSPRGAVHVNPNCGNRKSTTVSAIRGRVMKRDLYLADVKVKKLEKYYPKCKLKRADYGPLQWNERWRLSQTYYRPDMEKALLIASQYRPTAVKKSKMQDVTRLVQFNPHALFVLAGLSFKPQALKPKKVIREYNTKPSYREKVYERYEGFLKVLQQRKTCMPEEYEPKRSKKKKR